MSLTKYLFSLLIVVFSCANSKGTATNNNLIKGIQPTLAQKVAFLAYTAKFGKSYSSTQEFNARFRNWLATDQFLNNFDNNQVVVQHNKFSDWSEEERSGVLNSKLALEVLDLPAVTHFQSISSMLGSDKTVSASGILTATSCSAGQFLSGSTCLACPTGCKTCISATYCTACLTTNFTYSATTKLCSCTQGPINTAKTDCTACPVGTFYNVTTGTCINCLSGCSNCINTTSCDVCANNYQFIGGKCVCNGPLDLKGVCSPCASNEFYANGLCKTCPGNCTTCSVTTGACTACSTSFTLAASRCSCATGQTLVNNLCTAAISCTTGFYNQNNTCTACSPFCASCLSGSSCTQCVNNVLKIVNSTDSVPCYNCDPTFLNTPIGSCRCDPNKLLVGSTCTNLTVCSAAATYNKGDGTCLPCEAGCGLCASFTGYCYKTTDPSLLIDIKTGKIYCPVETFLSNLKCVPLIKCPIGKYNDGANNCVDCVSNCDVCTNVTGICSQCENTFTIQSDKTCVCLSTQFLDVNTPTNSGNCVDLKNCGSTFYNPGLNDCTACVSNCDVCSNVTGVCSKCLPTYTLGTDKTCACNPDPTKQWYKASTNECVDIITCLAGQFNDGVNNCLDCPANCAQCAFKTGICSSCNSTFTANTAANTCSCTTGQFMTASKNGVCKSCPALCPTCDDISGNCLTCVNNLVVKSSVTPNPCACTTGNYLVTSSKMCTTCATNCTACDDGTGLCSACSPTYTLTNGACACLTTQAFANGLCADMIPCQSGYYNQGNNVCTLGPVNCTTVAPWTGLCSTCNTTFTYDSSSNTCVCASNQYMNSSGLCQTCPQNCTACNAAGACTSCATSYTLQGSKCACNTTSTNQALVSGSCTALTACAPGKYNTGLNTCVNCPLAKCGTCNTYTGVCTACAATFTATLDASSNVQSCSCISGQFLNSAGQCQACPQNCTTCVDGTGLCTACGVGFTMDLPTAGACACNSNTQAIVNGQCVSLKTCPSGQYATNINTCASCPSYCTVCTQIYGKCQTCQNNLVVVPASNTCACVNNTYAFDGTQCQLCSTWVAGCDTCSSAGTCSSCTKGYVTSGNTCVCNSNTGNTGGSQYLDSAGYCNNCPKNCTTCFSTGNGLHFPAGQCSGCVSTYTASNLQYNVYWPPSGYGWDWYIDGTSNQWHQSTTTSVGTNQQGYWTVDQGNVPWGYVWYDPYGWTSWRWTGNYWYAQFCYNWPSWSNCYWQYYLYSWRSITCACVTGSQTVNTAGQCAAIITCPALQYNDGTNTCKSCGKQCAACSYGNAQCTTCFTGATFNAGSNVCSCPVGQYGTSSNTCAACPANCLACADTTGICTQCANNLEIQTATNLCGCSKTANLALVNGYCVPMTTPALGYYNPGDNTAVLCPQANCYNCTAYTGVCNTCNTTFTLTGTTCVCPSGTFKTSGGQCQKCPVNCTACSDFTGACTTCASNYQQNTPTTGYCGCASNLQAVVNNVCTALITCPAGQYNPGNNVCYTCPATNCATCNVFTGVCNACKATFTYTAASDYCGCSASQYLTSSGVCANCPANCTACSDLTGTCTGCTASYSLNTPTAGKCGCMPDIQAIVSGACVALTSCPDGQYNPGNNVCTNCATDCSTCQAYTGTCSQCKSTFINGTTPNTCVCPNSQFKDSTTGQCQKCATNCTACTSLTACSTCASTFTGTNGICGCTASQYMSSKTGTCLTCPTNCTACNDGTGVCTTCANTFDVQPDGSCSCNPLTQALVSGACVALISCPIGQYNPGNNVCTACTSNCYTCAPYTGQCTQCLPTFTYNQTPNTCTCTPSQYKITSTSPNTCANCAANCTTCADTTGACTGCVATFSQNTPAAGQCACNPTNQALVNGQCLSLTNCASPGQYNPGSNTCSACLTSNCLTCSNYTGVCSVCQPTFTLSSSKTCDCSSNQFINSTTQCQTCPQNCTTCSSPTGACSECTATFTLNSPTTGKCGCTGATPAFTGTQCEAMTVCPANQFNPGNNVCKACPANAESCSDITGIITACMPTYNQDTTSNTCYCNSTQFLKSDGTCGNCPANCSSCAATTGLCTKCKSTTMALTAAGDCGCLSTQTLINGACVAITTCPSGQYNPGTNVCRPCSTTCTACSYWTGACTACKTSFNLNNNNGTCACLSYQFLNQTTAATQTCINCPTNCSTCIAPKGACKTCATSFTLSNDKCSCSAGQLLIKGVCTNPVTCNAGQFNDGQNTCVACSANCASCSNATVCTTCAATFTNVAGACACPAKQALVNGACTSTFTVCPAGQYNLGNNTCGPCPQNCTTCNNTGYCTACKTSFTTNTPKPGMCGCNSTSAFSSGLCVKLSTCTTGTYNPGNNICTPCPANCTTCAVITGACTKCKPTFVLSSRTCLCAATQAFVKGACTTLYNCTAGNYNKGDNTCSPCVANCASCSAFTGTCTKCNVGYLLIDNVCVAARLLQQQECSNNCLKCDPSSHQCIQCNQNSVRSKKDPSQCEECQYAVGPVGNATLCVSSPFSANRIVPEFSAQDIQVDWRDWSVVGSVKDQGKCGGDFAFSTTAAAETAYAIKTGQLYDLSEQYLIDCDVGSFGCSGGFSSSSSKLLATEGAVLEQDYPYIGKQTGCRGNQVEKVFQLKYPGSQQITSSKEAFKSALRQGPLNVSFRVTHDAFFFYGGGILPGSLCPVGSLNHAMLAVGYGVENSVEYALIQNQWGVGWGEKGLIRVELTDDSEGPCGLYALSSQPTV